MQKRVSQVKGDYCFNLINTLIDYKGDVARNSKRTDGSIFYSPDFSPNNIRRLILSGDGARIDFHVSVEGKLSRVKSFSNTERLNMSKCLMLEDYKPMIWALADRVCSSIEEVIICTQSTSNIDLSRELNFEGLLRNRVGNIKDVKQAVSMRYKRLAYFSIVNCDISTLLKNITECNTPLSLISETNFVRGIGSITQFKSDWYNFYGHTSAYSLDKQGSKLNEHFKKVRQDFEDSKKKSAINDMKEERLKGVSDRFKKVIKNYNGVYTCIKKLSVILNTEGLNYLASTLPHDLSLDTSFQEPSVLIDKFNSLKSKDECEKFTSSVVVLSSNMYAKLASWFFNCLATLSVEYEITIEILLDKMDRRIAVPPNCGDLIKTFRIEFKGTSMSDSTSNICCYACMVLVTDVGSHNMAKYQLKDTWMSNFTEEVG